MAGRRFDPALRGRGLVALLAALVVAWVAAHLLAPSDAQLLPVDDVAARDIFTEEEISAAREYRRPQTFIGLGALAAQIALLALLARRTSLGTPYRGYRATFAVGGVLSVGLALVVLPFGIVNRIRAIDVGLSTDSWLEWARDRALGILIAAVLAGILAALAMALIRRLRRTWWIPGSVLVTLIAAVLTFATPAIIDPLFNDFNRLRDGPLRTDVLRLAQEAGVKVSEIDVIDASRRTTTANAYVTGLGATKKVVIYDNVVNDFPRAEARSILAHELAHEHFHDVPRGILYVAIVAPLALLAIALLVGPTPTLPALALALTILSTGIGWVSNSLSRKVEARADSFALQITREPDAFAELQRSLAVRNLSDPDPPGWVQTLFSTHPSTIERLGMAEAYQRTNPSP